MSSKKKPRKLRTEFRKCYNSRARGGDVTRQYLREDPVRQEEAPQQERVSGKGALTRKRTVSGALADQAAGDCEDEQAVIEAAIAREVWNGAGTR